MKYTGTEFWDVRFVVVPPDTAEALMPRDISLSETTKFRDVIDMEVLPRLTQITDRQFSRQPAIQTPEDIVIALRDSPILASAPEAVKGLCTGLDSANDAAHLYHSAQCQGLWIVAHRLRALRAAVFRYLRRLGCRFLAPNDNWIVIPKRHSIRILDSRVIAPRAVMLSYSGTGGLGPKGQPPLPNGEAPKRSWIDWDIRTAMPRELQNLAIHMGEAINRARQCECRAERSMMAWFKGQRGAVEKSSPTGTVVVPFPLSCIAPGTSHSSKPCYCSHGDGTGNYPSPLDPPWSGITVTGAGCTAGTDPANCTQPAQDQTQHPDSKTDPFPDVYSGFGGAEKIWCEYIRDKLAVEIQAWGKGHPLTLYTSAEAADGGFDCESTKCIDLLRQGPYSAYLTPEQQTQDASISDRYFHFSNRIAKFMAHWFGTYIRGISVSAYFTRSRLPFIPIEPNVLVQLVVAAQDGRQSNLSMEDYHAAWKTKRDGNRLGPFPLSVTKQWALPIYNFDRPVVSPRTVATETAWALNGGCIAVNVQNTHSSLTIGMHMLLLNEMLWDPNVTLEEFLRDWFAHAFGAAARTVRRVFERWWSFYEVTQHEVGASYRDLLEAQTIADAAGEDADVQTRLAHVKGYVRYQENYERMRYWQAQYTANPGPNQASFEAALEHLFLCIWGLYAANVVHSFRLHRSFLANAPGYVKNPDGSYTITPGSFAARWNLIDPNAAGWASVHEFTNAELHQFAVIGAAAYPAVVARREFSPSLVPLAVSVDSALVEGTTFTSVGDFAVYKATASDLTLEIRTQVSAAVAANVLPLRVKIRTASGCPVSLHEVPVQATATYHRVTIAGPAGVYTIEVHTWDPSIHWRWRVPKAVPFVVTRLRNSTAGFDNARRLYFYVPDGETRIVLAYNTKAPTGIRFYDPSGTLVPNTRVGLHQWQCDVGGGQAGKVWSFDGAHDTDNSVLFRFENCPPVVAYAPEQMMVPEELLN